jgi:hypothetical protein
VVDAIGKLVVVVPVILPEQLSVAVGAVNDATGEQLDTTVERDA